LLIVKYKLFFEDIKLAKTLVILESPGKVKAISKYLGSDYEVIASNGHIIDLPEKELGVDIDNDFNPSYQVIKGSSQATKIVKKIEDLAKSSKKVLIATDPDREGEAIGWHIATRIKELNQQVFRITFNEITKKGVMAGIENEGSINKDLVDAQQARRIMDRLVGYKVSPFLWKIVSNGQSAGRVQSVALRIICERDDSIAKFVPEEYWNASCQFLSGKGSSFDADLTKINGKEANISSEEEFSELLPKFKTEKYFIQNITKKEVAEAPPAPFITSTLLQESFKKLGFSTQKTMKIAQDLYEGIEIGEDGVQG
jgi:DNA topoisomerase-1